tara:strand:- start:15255 stop:15689 length:435 start_codon:yes stop_codon:yes gene_type:complete
MSDLLLKMIEPYEPKLKNRWLIRFKGDYKEIPIWGLSKTSRPKWVDGKWSDIEIHLRDPIGASTTKVLMTNARIAGSTGFSTHKKNKNKIKYHLELLDPTGVTIEKWKIKGVVKLFDFGLLDYAKVDLVEIKLVVKPTKVKLCF